MSSSVLEIDYNRLDILIDLAIEEDLLDIGDTTSKSVIPDNVQAIATFKVKEDCVIAGLPVAQRVFSKIDADIQFTLSVREGDFLKNGTVFAEMRGNAQSLLTAERTALNFMQRLSGVATASKNYSDATGNSKTVVLDTRKTTPGWRNLEKYAVAIGGATNHRMGLYDRVMIKDNHRELAGLEGANSITRSVERARAMYPDLEVEVEADTLEEVAEAIKANADYILLDNMSNEQMVEAVSMNNGSSKLEASGGITLERIPSISKIGVDFISVGALTHSVTSSDISMEINIG